MLSPVQLVSEGPALTALLQIVANPAAYQQQVANLMSIATQAVQDRDAAITASQNAASDYAAAKAAADSAAADLANTSELRVKAVDAERQNAARALELDGLANQLVAKQSELTTLEASTKAALDAREAAVASQELAVKDLQGQLAAELVKSQALQAELKQKLESLKTLVNAPAA